MAKENKEKEGDKKDGGTPPPESGSKISNTEWGMAIFALLIIDLIEIGLDALYGIGAFANPFIDLLVNMAWVTYLYLRGVNLKSTKNLATLFIGGGLQLIPGFDGFWAIEGTVIMFITKFEDKIKKVAGLAVAAAAIAAAPETGGASLAAEGAVEGGLAAGEAGAAAAGGEAGAMEGAAGAAEEGGMSDEYADSMGQESDASGQERESDNPYGDESEEEKRSRTESEEGDGDHEISDEDAENESKKNDSQSEGDKDDKDKDKDKKKKKPKEKQGGRNNLFDGGRRGGGSSPLGSQNKNRYRSPEEKAEDERLSFHSNLLDLSDPWAARKKKENDETSHSE